ncbi:g-protein coupled receptor [Botrytis cinerea]
MYGSAVSWCWIKTKWGWWRLWSFYVPVWITILITIMIYAVAGKKIFDKRQELVKANERISPDNLPKARKEKSRSSQTELLPTTNSVEEASSNKPSRPGIPPDQPSYASVNPNKQANAAMWAYAKVSLLFFLAMMITWIPSTANRIYSILYPDMVNMPLQYVSVFVLPLQGFGIRRFILLRVWMLVGFFGRNWGSRW